MEIVWLILKIIGIILLSVLGLILGLLLIVLFVPVRYKAEIEKQDKTKVRAEITWLLRIVRLKILYLPDNKDISVKVLFWKVYPKKKRKDETPAVGTELKSEECQIEEKKESSVPLNRVKEDFAEPAQEDKKAGLFERIKAAKKAGAEKKAAKKTKKSKPSLIKDFFQNADNLAGILKALDSIKKLLKHIFPKHVSGYVRFGTGDPCNTGKLLGLLAAFCGIYGDVLRVCPDFMEKCLETEIKIKGRVIIFTLLLVALRLWFDRKFKLLIDNFKKLGAEIRA